MKFRAEAWLERIEQHLAALPKAELDALLHERRDGGAAHGGHRLGAAGR